MFIYILDLKFYFKLSNFPVDSTVWFSKLYTSRVTLIWLYMSISFDFLSYSNKNSSTISNFYCLSKLESKGIRVSERSYPPDQ